ncbi:hypothetical protein [Maribellus sediminis]|uniref:hypothetical protein n=1 Tax=Maribellus sediminis TaxID=2696285 RepID=UPI0014313CD9|nr:hypothetical protein [Maribellus sediminis]
MTTQEFNTNLEKLTGKLEKEDSNYARIIRAVQIFYWIFIPVFAGITILEYRETHSLNTIVSGLFLMVAFLVIALTFRKYYKEYKYVDYSLPTLEMLKKAAYRYQPFQKRGLWVLLGLAFMDVGLTIDWLDQNTSVVHTQIFFGASLLVGFVIGLVLWYIRYKPIRDNALRLIKEIEE